MQSVAIFLLALFYQALQFHLGRGCRAMEVGYMKYLGDI